jgi:DNA-binding CsgD family transcriptional regulator
MNKKSILLKKQLHESECAGKMKEEAFEKIRLENDLLEQKSNVQQLEVQLKQQEMMYQSIKQADLIQINKSIRERLNPFRIKIQKKKDQEDFEKLLDEISSSANMSSLNDFDSIFKQMHGDFYEKLLQKAPDLTPSELQMCALLRINLSSKEIARLMNLSKATIDLTRHHIRQKLNLDSSQNLTSYLIVL